MIHTPRLVEGVSPTFVAAPTSAYTQHIAVDIATSLL